MFLKISNNTLHVKVLIDRGLIKLKAYLYNFQKFKFLNARFEQRKAEKTREGRDKVSAWHGNSPLNEGRSTLRLEKQLDILCEKKDWNRKEREQRMRLKIKIKGNEDEIGLTAQSQT